MGPKAKRAKLDDLQPCPYGHKCYRKNPKHFEEYSHPTSEDEDTTDTEDELAAVRSKSAAKSNKVIQIDTTKLPPCPFGAKCYRKNLLHFAEYSHPFTNDGASTSKDLPEDSSGSETDVIESDNETEEAMSEQSKNGKLKKEISRGPSLNKRYSLMSEEERKDLIKKALEMKEKLEKELAATKKTIEEKENAIKKMQDEMNKGALLMDGEAEALEGEDIKFYSLMPERNYKEGSAAQIHFRLAESQFYRLLSGHAQYRVTKVEYVVNPKLVKKFNEARKVLAKERGEEFSHPILAFHGTEEKNISPIVDKGFLIPGVDDKKLAHRTGNQGYYGRGIYFSEYTQYSIAYVADSKKIMLSKVLPGKIYNTPGVILGNPLEDGFDSHMSPCKKELVIFHSARILPCYIVHYDDSGQEFRYKKAMEDRRKVKSKDELMRLYWKAKKSAATTIFAPYTVEFCGKFADEVGELQKLVLKHGGKTVPEPTTTERGRGRGRGRAAAGFGFGFGAAGTTFFNILVTTETKFNSNSSTSAFNASKERTTFNMAKTNRAMIVREEYIYDSIIKKEKLDTEDYEFD